MLSLKLNDKYISLLIDILRIQTNSSNEKLITLYLMDYLTNELDLEPVIDAPGNIIVTKYSESKTKYYPCVVSHMDTVHDFVKGYEIYYNSKNHDLIFALDENSKAAGIGGDDKCGVFACLVLLNVLPAIKVVFFTGEEAGCKGSNNIDLQFFKDCRYILQLDRRGAHDLIIKYWGDNTICPAFSSEIGLIKKEFGFKAATGTVTDCMKLFHRKVGISCMNISSGYYNPHSANEYINIKELWHSIRFTEQIITQLKEKKYSCLPPPPKVWKSTTTTNTGGYDQCCKCHKWKSEELLYIDKWEKGKLLKICGVCKYATKVPTTSMTKTTTNDDTKDTGNNDNFYKCSKCGCILEKGVTFVYRGGNYICSNCDEKDGRKCWLCGKTLRLHIKFNDIRFGKETCYECANDIDNDTVSFRLQGYEDYLELAADAKKEEQKDETNGQTS